MSYYLCFDIETVPNDRAEAFFEDKVYTSKLSPINQPPQTILKLKNEELRTERLNTWTEEQSQKIEQDILSQKHRDLERAGLYWWTGKIITICVVPDTLDKTESFYGMDEKVLLNSFFNWIYTKHPEATLVGKSSADFDVPFIIGRAIALQIPLPPHFRLGHPIQDIDHIFSRSPSCSQRTKLDNYAWGMGIDGKTAKGSDVKGMYDIATTTDPSLWEEIVNYCHKDTAIVKELLTRYNKRFEPVERESIDVPFGASHA